MKCDCSLEPRKLPPGQAPFSLETTNNDAGRDAGGLRGRANSFLVELRFASERTEDAFRNQRIPSELVRLRLIGSRLLRGITQSAFEL